MDATSGHASRVTLEALEAILGTLKAAPGLSPLRQVAEEGCAKSRFFRLDFLGICSRLNRNEAAG
jgi:hypothetical protein